MSKLTCAIADDNERMLNLISDVVATDKSIEILGKAKDGEQLINIIKDKEPDVVLLDLITNFLPIFKKANIKNGMFSANITVPIGK